MWAVLVTPFLILVDHPCTIELSLLHPEAAHLPEPQAVEYTGDNWDSARIAPSPDSAGMPADPSSAGCLHLPPAVGMTWPGHAHQDYITVLGKNGRRRGLT